jgi:hypothetical protein
VRSQTYLARRVDLLADEDSMKLIAESKSPSKRIKRLIVSHQRDFE